MPVWPSLISKNRPLWSAFSGGRRLNANGPPEWRAVTLLVEMGDSNPRPEPLAGSILRA